MRKYIIGFNEHRSSLNESVGNREKFNLDDLQESWRASESKMPDTGLTYYDSFNEWFKKYVKSEPEDGSGDFPFTRDEMEWAWRAARMRRFDTGVKSYYSFNNWYDTCSPKFDNK